MLALWIFIIVNIVLIPIIGWYIIIVWMVICNMAIESDKRKDR